VPPYWSPSPPPPRRKTLNPKKLKITQNFTKSLSKHLFTCFKHKLIPKTLNQNITNSNPKI
jgi:hypothetical protein